MYRRRRYRRSISKYSWTKELRTVAQASTTGQVATLLYDAVVPSVVKGVSVDSISVTNVFQAIILVKAGDTLNTISLVDGATFYQPESNVMWWSVTPGDDPYTSRSVRKMNPGDKLYFVTTTSGAQKREAIVQFYVGS